MNKAVFLDRDNTLIHDNGYTFKTKDLKWKTGVLDALKYFSSCKYKLIVITNQSGIARNYFTKSDVERFHNYMNLELSNKYGLFIDKFYFSPYHIHGVNKKYKKESNCRKPGTLLFKEAIKEFNINSSISIAIGDKFSDLEPAIKCGVINNFLLSKEVYPIDGKYKKVVKCVEDWASLILSIRQL